MNCVPAFSKLDVRSKCGRVVLASFASHTRHDDVDAYFQIFSNALRAPETGLFLLGFSLDDLAARNAQVVVAKLDGKPLGGLYWFVDPLGSMWLRAVVVSPEFRGNQIAPAMVSLAIQHAGVTASSPPKPKAAIRLFADGRENESSRRAFQRIGFVASSDIEQSPLRNDFRDAHLAAIAETDENGLSFIRKRFLFGTMSVLDDTRLFLKNWTETVSI